MRILQLNNKDKYWYAVPKPLYKFESHHYWRLSLYELEKDLLDEYSHSNRMKPIIRHLKVQRCEIFNENLLFNYLFLIYIIILS